MPIKKNRNLPIDKVRKKFQKTKRDFDKAKRNSKTERRRCLCV